MKRATKLSLSKETLWRVESQTSSTIADPANDSCVQSCYLQSCEGGCTISMGQTD